MTRVNGDFKSGALSVAGAVILLLIAIIGWGGQRIIADSDNTKAELRKHASEPNGAHSIINAKLQTHDSLILDWHHKRFSAWHYQIQVNELLLSEANVPKEKWPKPPRYLHD